MVFFKRGHKRERFAHRLQKCAREKEWDTISKLLQNSNNARTKKLLGVVESPKNRLSPERGTDGSSSNYSISHRSDSMSSYINSNDSNGIGFGLCTDNVLLTLLNLCILNKCPMDTLKAFLQVDPTLSYQVDANGMTPLHILCATRGYEIDLVKFMLEHDDAKAAKMQDDSGRTPLHHLMFYICYPKRKDLTQWQQDGSTSSLHSYDMSVESEVFIEVIHYLPGGIHDNLPHRSTNEDEFECMIETTRELCRAASGALFEQDEMFNTPIDVLYNCIMRASDHKINSKRHRAEILRNVLKDELKQHYLREKQYLEKWHRKKVRFLNKKSDDSGAPYTTSTELSDFSVGCDFSEE